MSSLIKIPMGGPIPNISWSSIRQYTTISVAPLLLIATVYIWQNNVFGGGQPEQVLSITSDKSTATDSASLEHGSAKDADTIFIDISGAVNQPGIKELSSKARVNDAIWSASGYTDQADQQYLAQALNLAQPLQDGDKIYIPTYYEVSRSLPSPPVLLNKVNEPVKVIAAANDIKPGRIIGDGEQTSNSTQKVNINTATQAELDNLPGIGEVNAINIIEGRPYASTIDLCTNKVITNASTCEKIQELITVN